MWRNIAALWKEDHQVYVYPTDGPSKLTAEWLEVWNHMYPCAKKNWLWWVQIYLRERFMANHISYVIRQHQNLEKPIILVYLQRFHWQHVKFLLTKPSKREIWDYYFGGFREIDRKSISRRIKDLNPVFYKYWSTMGDFR